MLDPIAKRHMCVAITPCYDSNADQDYEANSDFQMMALGISAQRGKAIEFFVVHMYNPQPKKNKPLIIDNNYCAKIVYLAMACGKITKSSVHMVDVV